MDSVLRTVIVIFFFFNDTATTEIYTLSLHDALPISLVKHADVLIMAAAPADYRPPTPPPTKRPRGSGTLTLELEPTPDILATPQRARPCVVVGFAHEAGGHRGARGAEGTVEKDPGVVFLGQR